LKKCLKERIMLCQNYHSQFLDPCQELIARSFVFDL
jgi:hypothetical protein